LHEGILKYRLRARWGVEPDHLTGSSNSENSRAIKESSQFAHENNCLRNLHQLSGALLALNDARYTAALRQTICVYFGESATDATRSEQSLESVLDRVRRARNQSRAGHGMRPVRWEESGMALTATRALLDALVDPSDKWVSSYPFRPDVFEQIGSLLDSVADW